MQHGNLNGLRITGFVAAIEIVSSYIKKGLLNSMVYFFFILFLFSGLVFGTVVFIWALKNGQFKDQQRARYLAIDSDEDKSS